jgi:FG-GAP-like repeat
MNNRSIFALMATVFVLGATPTTSFAQSVTFSGATSFDVAQPNFFVTVNDFNGDGAKDLAVLLESNRVAILLGNGSGGFGTPTSFPVGNFPESIAVGDSILTASQTWPWRID